MTYHQQKGRGCGHVTVLEFCWQQNFKTVTWPQPCPTTNSLSWCSASRGFVSNSWATCNSV